MGKYHRSDSAFTTLARMVQSWSCASLIDGQGNFDHGPRSAAAMRYTEARLAKS
jgi:DNA gyrase/topoisomerase IV subunit A